jgi:hypothetical protein
MSTIRVSQFLDMTPDFGERTVRRRAMMGKGSNINVYRRLLCSHVSNLRPVLFLYNSFVSLLALLYSRPRQVLYSTKQLVNPMAN